MRRKQKNGNSLKFAFYFIALIVFLGGLSLAFKLGVVLKNSTFDGNNKYNLEIRKEKNACIISFSPQTNKIAIVSVDEEIKESVNTVLNVPIDAKLEGECLIDSSNIFQQLINFLPTTFNVDSKPTFIDVLRLMVFVKSIPDENISENSIKISSDKYSKQQLLSSLFSDQVIITEKKTIEIVNSTEVMGLGARLATMLNNIGGNIILVVTAEKPVKKSRIEYFGDESYTVQKLSSILGFEKVKKDKKGIADVIIVIGEDAVDTNRF